MGDRGEHVPLREVEAAYTSAAIYAGALSDFRLRWLARRTVRQAAGGDVLELARLRAIEHEFVHRGQPLP